MMLFPRVERREELPDGAGSLRHVREWLAAPTETIPYFEALRALPTYTQRLVRVSGVLHPVPTPRLESWHGDRGVGSYAYSGSKPAPRHPWTDALAELRQRVEHATGATFNAVLVNLYRDGQDSVAWHADDEATLGPAPVVASVSFGATRRFLLRRKDGPHTREETLSFDLGDGDLFVMAGALQKTWEHRVPKTEDAVGPRVNLTFRLYRPATAWRTR